MMQEIDRDKLRSHVQRLEELPLASPLAASFLDIVADDEVTIPQVAALVRQDPSLVARLVGLANAAYFGQSEPVVSVEDAIFKSLGLRLTKSLVLSMVLADSIGMPVESSGLNPPRFWLHAVLTASLARLLVEDIRTVPRPTPDEAYLAGMLHQFGVLPLVRLYPEALRDVLQEAEDDVKLSLELHRELGTDHHETGAWLARKWHLPASIITVIAYQHKPGYDGEHAPLVQLIRGSRELIGTLLAEENVVPERFAGSAVLEALGIPGARMFAGIRNLQAKLDAMRSLAAVLAQPDSAHG